MKLTPSKIKDFLKQINKNNSKAILIFGKDSTITDPQLQEISDFFIEQKYKIKNITQEQIKLNNSILLEEFQTFSFFETNILFVLKLIDRPNDFTKILKAFFETKNLNTNNFLIIVADDLTTTSSLRKFCEAEDEIGVVACYEDEERTTKLYIQNKLKENNLTVNNDIIDYVYNNVGANKLIINNEIEKISLYLNEKTLTIEDVQKCIKNISSFDLNDLINNICYLKKNETFNLLNKAQEENIANIVIVRSLIKYFLQMQKLLFKINNGSDIDSAVNEEFIFWKQKPIMKQHLQKWKLETVNILLEKFIELEKNVKFSSNNLELNNFFIKFFIKFK